MLVLSWRGLDHISEEADIGFEVEYFWENFILRLWLYRTTVKTLTRLTVVSDDAVNILEKFDSEFDIDGRNGLKALRDTIEHFDDYAVGKGRGPAIRMRDLDPWREISRDRYERGQYFLDRKKSYAAAVALRSDANRLSEEFIRWHAASA